MAIIDEFEKEYFFLSNFYRCPVYFDGITYNSSECAYQAQKTLDIELRKKIAKLTPRQIWEGTPPRSNVYNFEQRPDWEEVKNNLMYRILYAKFMQNDDLHEKLVNTGDAILIEGNSWHDNYWGNCKCEACKKIAGFNQLGKTLMRLRTEFRGEKYTGIWMDNYIGITHRDVAMQILRTPVKPPCNN